MANYVEYNGFEETLGSLKKQFGGRGLDGFYITESSELDRRDLRTRLENPGSSRLEDIMRQDFSNYYRSGRDEGRAYMTVDDFLQLNRDERRFRLDTELGRTIAKLEKEQGSRRISTACRPAHPYSIYEVNGINDKFEKEDNKLFVSGGRRETVYDGGFSDRRRDNVAAAVVNCGETEMKLRPVGGETFFTRINNAIFRRDLVAVSDKRIGNSNGLAAALAIVAVFMLVLALPITLSVMKHSAATTVQRLESEIRKKEAEKTQLEIELEKKNDLFLIESLAKEKYGMVELEKSVFTMIKINPVDSVEHSEDEGSEGIMPALLSALGLRAGK